MAGTKNASPPPEPAPGTALGAAPNPPTAGKSGAAAAAVAARALELWDPFQLSLLLDAHIAGGVCDVPTGSHELKAKLTLAYETWCKALTAAGIPSPIPPVQAQRKFKAIIAPGSTAREWLAIDKAVQAGASSAVAGEGFFEAATACVKKAEEYRSRVTGVFVFSTQLNYY